ncbi:MAG: hypothetical protein ACI4D0_10620 [Lachnospira sp.]
MDMNPKVLEFMKNNNNIIITSQMTQLGFTRSLLSLYVKEGLLERGRHGIYILPDSVHDDMYTLMMCSEKIIFSHDTALFLNHLSDRTPFIHSVTIPSNTKLSKQMQEECICYYIKPELHKLGVVSLKTTFGNDVRSYNAERTICDILRSRNKMDEETNNISFYEGFDQFCEKEDISEADEDIFYGAAFEEFNREWEGEDDSIEEVFLEEYEARKKQWETEKIENYKKIKERGER